MITNLRERIKQAMTIERKLVYPLGEVVTDRFPPSDAQVDRVEKLVNEMLAEAKCGNGS